MAFTLNKPRHNFLRRGQTMLFLIMVVVILAFIALWNFDLHKVIFVKTLSRNASDAAVIAGARWQGITLNLLGELNVAQALAIDNALTSNPQKPDYSEALSIAGLQAIVRYAGPMVGYAAAQQSAKNNGAYVNSDFTLRVHNHAQAVRAMANNNVVLLDYANMLDAVASGGIAALAGDYAYHILLDRKFYAAIEARNWCWFYDGHYGLLANYGGWQTWPPINFQEPLAVNIITLPTLASLENYLGDPNMPAKALQQLSTLAGHDLTTKLTDFPPTVPATWYCYDYSWTNWDSYLQGLESGAPYPFISTIKSQYNVLGAAVAMRVSADPPPAYFYFNNRTNTNIHITSVAAAKPFGYLTGPVPPSSYGILLPAFHDARLIPVDSAGVEPPPDTDNSNGLPDDHISIHLPLYLKYGPNGISQFYGICQYCRDLSDDSSGWENAAFRQSGVEWLALNATNCFHAGGGGGGGGGGGSAHGH